MGPLNVEKAKSICLLGPPGCGKKHIVYAVAAEIGAVVFNLNSDVVYKYKENMPYFVHLVTKMATMLQPTVLFIDGAHKPFIKKVFLSRADLIASAQMSEENSLKSLGSVAGTEGRI